jgi:hypothetical protein
VRPALLLVAMLAGIPTPRPPTLAPGCPPHVPVITRQIETNPVVYADPANNNDQPGRVLLPNGTAEYTFTSVSECIEPLAPLEPEDPANFAPTPPIDPGFDEFSPTGPVDGPGEGPGQGTPADKPAP